jgi:NAD(P)-dependent dehydrogenase (short-subunit alcohol dehydrogenase family)
VGFRGKVVVVTGAASGIGREIARAFTRRGADLALADINEEGLLAVKEELEAQGSKVYTQVVDVSSAGQVKDFRDKVYEEMGRVDVLCNNAGRGMVGRPEDITLDDWEWMMGTNLWGVIYGCHYFYPSMIEQGGGGHILNTASSAGLVPAPLVATPYCCTKFGVVGFSETLRAEASLHGIGVSVLCPGLVDTDIFRTTRMRTGARHLSPEELQKWMMRVFKRRNYPPSRAAEAAVKAVEKNKGVVPVCPEAYAMDFLYRLSRRAFGSFRRAELKIIRGRQQG